MVTQRKTTLSTYLSVLQLCSNSGQFAALSRQKQEFDSPTEYQGVF